MNYRITIISFGSQMDISDFIIVVNGKNKKWKLTHWIIFPRFKSLEVGNHDLSMQHFFNLDIGLWWLKKYTKTP